MKSNSWNAFRIGLSRASHYRWVLLILFAVNLFSALLLTALPAWGLAAGMGHRPAIHQAADGVDAWLVIETLMSPLVGVALGGGSASELAGPLRQATLLGLLTTLALPLIAWLPAAFLSGGLLLTYAEAPTPFDKLRTAPFRWRRFLWGCWRWFGAFLLLNCVQGIASTTLFVPIASAVIGVVALAGGWLMWVIVPLLALIIALWLALMECTRIATVVGQTRNVFQAFGEAVRFVFRNFLAVVGLYGLALLLLGLLHALYRWGLMPHLPLDWWPLVLVVQQAFILARLWARLARMAGGVTLYRELINR